MPEWFDELEVAALAAALFLLHLLSKEPVAPITETGDSL